MFGLLKQHFLIIFFFTDVVPPTNLEKSGKRQLKCRLMSIQYMRARRK